MRNTAVEVDNRLEEEVKSEVIEQVPSLISESIKMAEIAISDIVLADALNSEALSWYFEYGIREVKLIDKLNKKHNNSAHDNAFDEDFRITAKITLRHLLKAENDKFSALIEDINRPQHMRTRITNALIQDVAMNIKEIAKVTYLEREKAKKLDQ